MGDQSANVTIATVASEALGLVVGLLAVTIFAVILRCLEEKAKPKDVIDALYKLITLALGGGVADYVVFDLILENNSILYYVAAFSGIFLVFGLIIFIDWLWRKS